MFILILLIPLAYLLGSVPSSVWLGKLIKGVDLREHGSGNAGATNAFRVLGVPIGITVFVLDMLKGYAAVKLILLQSVIAGGDKAVLFQIALGIVAVGGHIFPVFAGFKGGKGVATIAGVSLALHPLSAACAIGIYGLVFALSRISSLGSLAAVISYPLWMILVFDSPHLSLRIFSLLVPVLVIVTHRSNIKRLFRRREA